MDGKGRLSARNWEFLDHTAHTRSVLKPVSGIPVSESNASGHQAAFLKMSSYPDRNPAIDESNTDVPSMDFSWISNRNYQSHAKNMTSLHVSPVNSEMIDVPNVAVATPENAEFNTKPATSRKKASSMKKANRVASKALRLQESEKQPSVPKKRKGTSASTGKREKKSQDTIVEGALLDFSSVPAPVCSCTGVSRQCYRWGAGGWQSSCCTTTISEYPLPMSSSRPGARLAGRKMSIGAYGKLLQRLAAEGHDLSFAVDLKNYWARHGTNKFVTIR